MSEIQAKDNQSDKDTNDTSHLTVVNSTEINRKYLKINFRYNDDDVCLDNCAVWTERQGIKIGSGACAQCDFNQGSEDDESIVCSEYQEADAKRQCLNYELVD
jgi:hypothetical protein